MASWADRFLWAQSGTQAVDVRSVRRFYIEGEEFPSEGKPAGIEVIAQYGKGDSVALAVYPCRPTAIAELRRLIEALEAGTAGKFEWLQESDTDPFTEGNNAR